MPSGVYKRSELEKNRLYNNLKYSIRVGMTGKKHSEHSKKKMSNSKLGKHYSTRTEFKKGNPPWNKGKKLSDEYRKKLSESHKGLQSYWKGRKRGAMSDEWKRKISEANRGGLKGTLGKVV